MYINYFFVNTIFILKGAFMISICLKSSNKKSLNELEKYLDNTTFPNIFYSQKKFKHFYNLIIHYTGKKEKSFYNVFSNLLSEFIINNFEKKFIMKQLSFDFFYFSKSEKQEILTYISKTLNTNINTNRKVSILQNSIINFFINNSVCNLEGFINFRISDYKNFINLILEKEINDFVIKKEYSEYVNLLQEYINMQTPQTDIVHLIYSNTEKFLLDNSRNIISTDTNQRYISDISFSANDFILNSLLSSLPQKIIIHLNTEKDNFINFLELIFKDRFIICTNCDICHNYSSINSSQKY